MRCSKTCTAQTYRTQTIEEGCLPHIHGTASPWLAPNCATLWYDRACSAKITI